MNQFKIVFYTIITFVVLWIGLMIYAFFVVWSNKEHVKSPAKELCVTPNIIEPVIKHTGRMLDKPAVINVEIRRFTYKTGFPLVREYYEIKPKF